MQPSGKNNKHDQLVQLDVKKSERIKGVFNSSLQRSNVTR